MPRTKRGAGRLRPLRPITLRYEVTLTLDRDTFKLRLIKEHIISLMANGRAAMLSLDIITNSIQSVKVKRIIGK